MTAVSPHPGLGSIGQGPAQGVSQLRGAELAGFWKLLQALERTGGEAQAGILRSVSDGERFIVVIRQRRHKILSLSVERVLM